MLVRVCGASFDWLESLRGERIPALLHAIRATGAAAAAEAALLVEELYAFASTQTTSSRRRFVIELKRDIFNQRLLPPERFQEAGRSLPAALVGQIAAHQRLLREVETLQREGALRWEQEMIECRRRFGRTLCLDSLTRGLAMSSRAMYESRVLYEQRALRATGKRTRRAERSLLKYLSRLCAKTSPLSTFTSVASGVLVDHGGIKTGGTSAIRSRVRPNHFLFGALAVSLRRIPTVRMKLRVQVNPTLRRKDGSYRWCTDSPSGVRFRSVADDPVLVLLLSCLRSQGHLAWGELLDALARSVDASREELDATLGSLVENGFLEARLATSGCDPHWLDRLLEELRPMADDPSVSAVHVLLSTMGMLSAELGDADANVRIGLLDSASRLVNETLAALEEISPDVGPRDAPHARKRFAAEDLFFEDTSIDLALALDRSECESLATALSSLVSALPSSPSDRAERQCLYRLHRTRRGGVPVDLLDLYETYIRHRNAVGAGGGRQETDDSCEERWAAVLRDRFAERASSRPAVLDIGYDDLLEAASESARVPDSEPRSHAGLLQVYASTDLTGRPRLQAVLNSLTSGHGRLYGRFLPLLDGSVHEDLVRWNEETLRDVMGVEVRDASYFNANVHPSLLPYEVLAPSGHSQLPPERRIALRELEVCADEGRERLYLRHIPSARRVATIDSGLERRADRSPLYRFLHLFSDVDDVDLRPLLRTVGEVWNGLPARQLRGSRQVIEYPRVVFEHRIVLYRRSWSLPHHILPRRHDGESNWAYVLRVDRWRGDLGLPARIFVTRDPHRTSSYTPSARGQDDHKPQYVDFESPLFSQLFAAVLRRTKETLKVQEMLPGPEEIPVYEGERRVTEVALQWHGP